MPTGQVYIAQTITGAILQQIEVTSTTIVDSLDGQSTSAHLSVPVRAGLRPLLTPWRCCVVVADGDRLLWAGPITAPPTRPRGAAVDVTASSVWSLLARRGAWLPTATPPAEEADLVVTRASARGLAAAVLSCALSRGPLPIVVPTDGLDGGLDRTWPSYEMHDAASALRGLVDDVDSTPVEVHFSPRWAGGHNRFEWAARIGNPRLPSGQAHRWDSASPAVVALTESGPGDDLATRAWVGGAGQERTRVVGYGAATALEGAGWPVLETIDTSSASSIESPVLADARARARARRRPGSALTPVVDTEGTDTSGVLVAPQMGTWQIGDVARIDVTGDPWTPDGTYGGRIVGWSHTVGTQEVALDLDTDQADLDQAFLVPALEVATL